MADLGSTDFSLKPTVDVTGLASLLQRKKIAEIEAQQREKAQKFTELQTTIGMAQNLATSMVENSRARQRQAFVRDLGDAMAAMVPVTETKFDRPTMLSTQVPPMTGVANPNVEKQDAVRLAANLVPDEAGKAVLSQLIPKPVSGIAAKVNPMKLEFPDGTQGLGYFDPVAKAYFQQDGTLAPMGTRGAYKYDTKELSDGGLGVVSGASGRMVGHIDTAAEAPKTTGRDSLDQFTKVEQARLKDAKEALQSDPVFKQTQTKANDLDYAMGVLETENWVGDATITSLLAKGLGRDAGALSDQDRQIYQMSPEVWRSIKTKANRWIKGKITAEDRDDIREALRVASLKNRDLANRRVDMFINQGKVSVKNADKDFLRAYMFEAAEQQPAKLTPEDEANQFLQGFKP